MGKHLKGGSGRSYGDGRGAGYCNPPGPKWKRGQSGNPSGVSKKKNASKLSTRELLGRDMEALLGVLHIVGGEELSIRQAILRRIANEACGNAKLGISLLKLSLEVGDRLMPDESEFDDINEDERLIIEATQRRYQKAQVDEEEPEGPADEDNDG